MKKKFASLMLAGLLAFSTLSTAFAGTWLQDNVGWWYQNDDGSYPANGWHWIDGNNDGTAECYYFNESGYCLINTTTPDGYTVDINGAWIIDGVIQTKVTSLTPTTQSTITETTKSKTAQIPTGISIYPYDGYTIVVNTNTHKYHVPSCSSVSDIKSTNLGYSSDSTYLNSNGYAACKRCH